MKLTPELIAESPSFINATKDRELDLRGNKIHTIENLGASKDLHDSIDLSQNDIRHLGNFPTLHRLTTLIVSNNRITNVDPLLPSQLPNLESLVLTNNAVAELQDLEPLTQCPKLKWLVVLDNPVAKKKWYREWLVWKCKGLRVLDFKRVRQQEREEARQLFELKNGEPTSLARSITDSTADIRTFDTIAPPGTQSTLGISPAEQARIKEAIAKADSLDEVTRLEKLLRSGHVPGDEPAAKRPRVLRDNEMEEEED